MENEKLFEVDNLSDSTLEQPSNVDFGDFGQNNEDVDDFEEMYDDIDFDPFEQESFTRNR